VLRELFCNIFLRKRWACREQHNSIIGLTFFEKFSPKIGTLLKNYSFFEKSTQGILLLFRPRSYWDDWMRLPTQRRERACIRPEVGRTKTFGKIGVSNGLFFDKHLKFIQVKHLLL
jgi:hypothetical protein